MPVNRSYSDDPMSRSDLASVAEGLARRPFYGNLLHLESNLEPVASHFGLDAMEWIDSKWCAAFVYHCTHQAGVGLPPRHPEPVSCSFAGVKAWLEWAKLQGFYRSARRKEFEPKPGDLIIYDRIFDPGPHDHIGIVIGKVDSELVVAEGNVGNVSAVVQRTWNSHVRGFVRIPADFTYDQPSAG
jgi:hypothetical protein